MDKSSLGAGRWEIQGWRDYDVSYFPPVECYTNLPSNWQAGKVSSLTVPLATNMPAGTYHLYVALATQNTNLMVGATVGSARVYSREYSGNVWTRLATITSSLSFTNVSIEVTKLTPVGTSQVYWFAGVGLVNTNLGELAPMQFVDCSVISEQETKSLSNGNLVPNSSFEFGLGAYGWTSARNGSATNEMWLSNMTTNDAYDGLQAVVLTGGGYGGSRAGIYSPAIRLRGERMERQYTLSFYHKKLRGNPMLTFRWEMVYTGVSGFITNSYASTILSPQSSWRRFSTNVWLKPLPNRLFQLSWSTSAETDAQALAIDAVQVEEGAVATTYAQADPVECNLTLGRNGNLLDVDKPRTVTVELNNSTLNSSNVVLHYDAYDWMNRRIASGIHQYTANSGYSTQTLTLDTTNNGLTRIFGWLDNSPSFRSELCFSIVPLPSEPILETNSFFATHACQGRSLLLSNLNWGISWQRGLSPGGIAQWSEIEPSSNSFSWYSTDVKVDACTNAAILLANLCDFSDLPTWAMTNGVPRLDCWSNYVYRVVNRYKDRIRFWEDLNEPYHHWSASVFSQILEITVAAVKAADPSAYFVAMGGGAEGNDNGFCKSVWDLLSDSAKSRIDALSVHAYPRDGDDVYVDRAAALFAYTGKPIWNTEAGVWQWGSYKGDRCGGVEDATPYIAHWTEYQYRRSVWQQPAIAARSWLRALGRGMAKYFYYDGRLSSYRLSTENTNPTWFNYDDSMNSVGVTLLWSKFFCDQPRSVSNPTNSNFGTNCLAFVFGRDSGVTLTVFSLNLSNYVASVTNGAFAVYDLHGNLLQTNRTTATISRIPTYWISSSLSAAGLHQLYQYASIRPQADITAPAVSIDVVAHGPVDNRQLPLRFRWTAVDDWLINGDESPNAVETRYRFNGLSEWSSWSAERTAELTQLPSRPAFLEVQARDAYGNESAIVSGPEFAAAMAFSAPSISPPPKLRVVDE